MNAHSVYAGRVKHGEPIRKDADRAGWEDGREGESEYSQIDRCWR